MLLFVQPLSGNFVINYQAMLPLHSYRLLIKSLSSLLNGAMLTGSVRHSKFALFLVSGLEDEKLIIKQTYKKTEQCKLF